MNEIIIAILFIIVGYVSGSVLYGYWIPKILKNADVYKESKDHNPGISNAFHYGVGVGLITVICDVCKAHLPVTFALKILSTKNPLLPFVMLAPVLGHCYPIFKRKGGKAIGPSAGVGVAICKFSPTPLIFMLVCYLLFSLVICITNFAVRIIALYSVTTVVTFITCPFMVGVGILFIAILVSYKHILSTEDWSCNIEFLKNYF